MMYKFGFSSSPGTSNKQIFTRFELFKRISLFV